MQNLQISNNRSLWHLAKCLKKSAKSIHSVLDCPPFGAPVSDCRPWVALLLEANVMTLPGWSEGSGILPVSLGFCDVSKDGLMVKSVKLMIHPGAPTDAPALVTSIVLSSNSSRHLAHQQLEKNRCLIQGKPSLESKKYLIWSKCNGTISHFNWSQHDLQLTLLSDLLSLIDLFQAVNSKNSFPCVW